MSIRLGGVIPWGRTFEEYRLIFSLSEADLAGRILGCGDGPASFNAEATARRHRVVSCDPVYAHTSREIERRVRECHPRVLAEVSRNASEFVWDHFRDADDLGDRRLAAMLGFVEDFERGKGEGRYVEASLPTLPFGENGFSLALVSHLLFLYSRDFGLDFHLASVAELLRVADEVRIFPLVALEGGPSPHAGPVIDHLRRAGHEADVVQVEYEFQKGGNRMLRVRRGTESTAWPRSGAQIQ